MSTESEPYTIVNHVVEFRRPDHDRWLTWPQDYGTEEAGARKCYASLRQWKTHRGGQLMFRIVKRTAVITDEVILEESEEPEAP